MIYESERVVHPIAEGHGEEERRVEKRSTAVLRDGGHIARRRADSRGRGSVLMSTGDGFG